MHPHYVVMVTIHYYFDTGTGTGSVKEWSNWTNCSQSCGGGLRNRSRSCLTPPCILNLNESEYCNTNLCPGKIYEDTRYFTFICADTGP